MATIRKEIEIERTKEFVWDAIRDVGAIHKRLVPGFVVDCRLEGDSRIVTFANGMVARELIVNVDDERCRHSWSARGGPLTHHNASIQVFSDGRDKCRVVWIADCCQMGRRSSSRLLKKFGMLREPQHERKIINDISFPPFVLSLSKDSDRVFQQPASEKVV